MIFQTGDAARDVDRLDPEVPTTAPGFACSPNPRFIRPFHGTRDRLDRRCRHHRSWSPDDRMYVIDPIDKAHPWTGSGPPTVRFFSTTRRGTACRPSAATRRERSFRPHPNQNKRIRGSPRLWLRSFVLDIWTDYFGQSIGWHFLTDLSDWEIVLPRPGQCHRRIRLHGAWLRRRGRRSSAVQPEFPHHRPRDGPPLPLFASRTA